MSVPPEGIASFMLELDAIGDAARALGDKIGVPLVIWASQAGHITAATLAVAIKEIVDGDQKFSDLTAKFIGQHPIDRPMTVAGQQAIASAGNLTVNGVLAVIKGTRAVGKQVQPLVQRSKPHFEQAGKAARRLSSKAGKHVRGLGRQVEKHVRELGQRVGVLKW